MKGMSSGYPFEGVKKSCRLAGGWCQLRSWHKMRGEIYLDVFNTSFLVIFQSSC